MFLVKYLILSYDYAFILAPFPLSMYRHISLSKLHKPYAIYTLSDADYFIICGDLNSRIGDEKDYIPDVDDVIERKVLDTSRNQHGQNLLEFLLETKFGVVNGRVSPENDAFTSVTHKGKSVVDYFLVPHYNVIM